MAEVKIPAVARTEFGKGAARRTRRAGLVPAVLYGHGADPVHVSLPGHETLLALRVANALLAISIDGDAPQLALPKQVQRHPVRHTIEHVDLLIVRRGERVVVSVPVVLVGEPVVDVLVNQGLNELSVSAEATHIPAQIEISIDGLNVGAQILAGEVVLPEGVELADDPEVLVLSINASIAVEDMLETAEAEAVEEGGDQDAESAGE